MEIILSVEIPVKISVIDYISEEKETKYCPGAKPEVFYDIELVNEKGISYDSRIPSILEHYIREQLDTAVELEVKKKISDNELDAKIASQEGVI